MKWHDSLSPKYHDNHSSPMSRYIEAGQASAEELDMFIKAFKNSDPENEKLILKKSLEKRREYLVKLWIED